MKAAPIAAPVAGHLLRERTANQMLSAHIPAPHMVWTDDVAGWHLLVFEHAPGQEANLAPGSSDLPFVMDTVAAIAGPCPWTEAPSVMAKATALLREAEAFLADSPGHGDHEPLIKTLDLNELGGTALLHADLHAGNLLVDGDRCRVVDWSMACQGAPWVDVALLIPRLIDAGHTPTAAEAVAARVPAWGAAPAGAVTALTAARTLFAARLAEVGPAHLRAKRLRTATACQAWVEYRTS